MVAKCMTVLVVLAAMVSFSDAQALSGVFGAGNYDRSRYPNGPEDLYNTQTTRFQPPPRVGLSPNLLVNDLSVATRFQQPAVITSDDRWMVQNLYYKPVPRPLYY